MSEKVAEEKSQKQPRKVGDKPKEVQPSQASDSHENVCDGTEKVSDGSYQAKSPMGREKQKSITIAQKKDDAYAGSREKSPMDQVMFVKGPKVASGKGKEIEENVDEFSPNARPKILAILELLPSIIKMPNKKPQTKKTHCIATKRRKKKL